MKRKRIISRLKHEIRRLRRENKKLHDKHWSECRRISQYDKKEAKRMATIYDFARMCRANNDCEFCPMAKAKLAVDYECSTCAEMIADHPDEANAAILKWCAEQPTKPKKTYKEDFLEKFPNAPLNQAGCPHGCVYHIYGDFGACRATCSNCWNEVMPDE